MAPHRHPLDPERVSAARAGVGSPDEARALAELFRLLGDPVRARITLALGAAGELCVGDLVQRRRAGRVIYYRLADTRLDDLIARGQKIVGR